MVSWYRSLDLIVLAVVHLQLILLGLLSYKSESMRSIIADLVGLCLTLDVFAIEDYFKQGPAL